MARTRKESKLRNSYITAIREINRKLHRRHRGAPLQSLEINELIRLHTEAEKDLEKANIIARINKIYQEMGKTRVGRKLETFTLMELERHLKILQHEPAEAPPKAKPQPVYSVTIRLQIHRQDLEQIRDLLTRGLAGLGCEEEGELTDDEALDLIAQARDMVAGLTGEANETK